MHKHIKAKPLRRFLAWYHKVITMPNYREIASEVYQDAKEKRF
jgi:hypothetical protein